MAFSDILPAILIIALALFLHAVLRKGGSGQTSC